MAEEAMDYTREIDQSFVTGWAGVALAAALRANGDPARSAEVLLFSAGGEELPIIPGGWRAYGGEVLTRCYLELGRPGDAARVAAAAEATAEAVGLPMAAAWANRAAAFVALDAGDPAAAAERALAATAFAEQAGAVVEAALSRTLAGRALAEAGNEERAVSELERAAGELDNCGASRYRDAAERELRKLGQHIHRRTRKGTSGEGTLESLSERELEVARLVVDRMTNKQIAAELYVSLKTVEAHMRNLFRKLDVSSRVEVARVVERADRIQGSE